MKEIIGFIILILCFLLAAAALKANDIVVGLIAIGLYLIGDKIFRY